MISECINGDGHPVENQDTGLCASCGKLERKAASLKLPDDPKPIQKQSCSQRKMLEKYNRKRKMWLRGKKCAVHPNCKESLTCHHMSGRVGFADEWARENDLPLLLDERFWLPVCIEAHAYIESHPKWAFENQYSFKRITDPIFIKNHESCNHILPYLSKLPSESRTADVLR